MKYYNSSTERPSLTTVVCGSFRRDPVGLEKELAQLQAAGCTVLSPAEVEFVRDVEGFVYTRADEGKSTLEIERGHLRSMERADLVWLHCPEGYVGRSAAMELGFARALGLRVFAGVRPEDVALADMVEVVASPQEAARAVDADLGEAPAHALLALQSYYARAAARRGWSGETVPQTVDLLKGEVEELEAALSEGDADGTLLEMADVQLYLVHLANLLGADLGAGVVAKEKVNSARFERNRERIVA